MWGKWNWGFDWSLNFKTSASFSNRIFRCEKNRDEPLEHHQADFGGLSKFQILKAHFDKYHTSYVPIADFGFHQNLIVYTGRFLVPCPWAQRPSKFKIFAPKFMLWPRGQNLMSLFRFWHPWRQYVAHFGCHQILMLTMGRFLVAPKGWSNFKFWNGAYSKICLGQNLEAFFRCSKLGSHISENYW